MIVVTIIFVNFIISIINIIIFFLKVYFIFYCHSFKNNYYYALCFYHHDFAKAYQSIFFGVQLFERQPSIALAFRFLEVAE